MLNAIVLHKHTSMTTTKNKLRMNDRLTHDECLDDDIETITQDGVETWTQIKLSIVKCITRGKCIVFKWPYEKSAYASMQKKTQKEQRWSSFPYSLDSCTFHVPHVRYYERPWMRDTNYCIISYKVSQSALTPKGLTRVRREYPRVGKGATREVNVWV